MSIKKIKVKVKDIYKETDEGTLVEYVNSILQVFSCRLSEDAVMVRDKTILVFNLGSLSDALVGSDLVIDLSSFYEDYAKRVVYGHMSKECSLSISCLDLQETLERCYCSAFDTIKDIGKKVGGILFC